VSATLMMNESFLINFTPQETRVALLQQGVVQEIHIERTSSRGIVGNIYLGKVQNVLPGMEAAFIDIGQERVAIDNSLNGYNCAVNAINNMRNAFLIKRNSHKFSK